jgi:hypothetical protein
VYFRLSNFFLQGARVGTEGVLAHPQATVYPHMLMHITHKSKHKPVWPNPVVIEVLDV